MDRSRRLLDLYLPPAEGFILESLVATTYQVDFEFFEEELLAAALGVRTPTSRMRSFRSEFERRLQTTDVSVLYDLRACERLARLSPRIDPVPIVTRKLHSKISLLTWVRHEADGSPPNRLIRLIVGSANLTRQGFRENYECVVSVDYGGGNNTPRALLTSAIGALRQIAEESTSPQLQRQLASVEQYASLLADGQQGKDDPSDFVVANEVLSRLEQRWNELSTAPPEKLTIVSPFWPEGVTAAEGMLAVIRRLDAPLVELVCRGVASEIGDDWVPEFDAEVATDLKSKMQGRLFLRAALPYTEDPQTLAAGEDSGDEMEEHELGQNVAAKGSHADLFHRALHAKLILADGPAGSVLYAGSSNCTRRGLGLVGGQANWEAGFVYRLTPKQRNQIKPLLAFMGPQTEVLPDTPLQTEKPLRDDEPPVPTFIAEVTAEGTKITVKFRRDVEIPESLVLLMEVPSITSESHYWMLFRRSDEPKQSDQVVRELSVCPKCDGHLVELANEQTSGPILPHVCIEVRWEDHTATFPVRFDDKATLPLLLVGRKPTEGELIEYFLFGREPGEDSDDLFLLGNGNPAWKPDAPVDTRRILAYFMRRFVQAIPGIEAEIQQASYSSTALEAALRGPTSPLELAERAFASLSMTPSPDEPEKTPIAVGFQIAEIIAALCRCQQKIEDQELQACFEPVHARCQELLQNLIEHHPDLGEGAFRAYCDRFVGAAR